MKKTIAHYNNKKLILSLSSLLLLSLGSSSIVFAQSASKTNVENSLSTEKTQITSPSLPVLKIKSIDDNNDNQELKQDIQVSSDFSGLAGEKSNGEQKNNSVSNKKIDNKDLDDEKLNELLNKGLNLNKKLTSLSDFSENKNQDTLLKRMAKSQAKLSILNVQSKIEKSKMEIKTARLKFLEQKAKYKEELAKNKKEDRPSGSSSSFPFGFNQDGEKIKGAESLSLQRAVLSNMPTVKSIYSFNGEYSADISLGDNRFVVKEGDTLLNGDKVLNITATSVKVRHNGHSLSLPLGGVNYSPMFKNDKKRESLTKTK